MNFQKILANLIIGAGLVTVACIPFIVFYSSTFFPFITGKNYVFRIAVEIITAAYLVLAAIDPAYRPQKSPFWVTLGIFLGVITLAAMFGENPTKSFWSNFERMEGVVTYLHLAAYFLVLSTVLTVRNMWRQFLNLNLLVGVGIGVYGIMQWLGISQIVGGGDRITSALGNAAYLGTYALFNIFIAAFFIVRQGFTLTGERVRLAVYGAIILLQTFVLYHTATRGAMLGLIAGVLLSALLVAFSARKKVIVRTIALGVLAGAVVLILGFIAIKDTSFVRESPVLERFASISLTEQTTKSRFMVWGMAIEGFKEHPVLGWGMENFNYVFNKYYNPNMWDQEQWFDRAHNVFFDWLIAAGLPGLLSYLGLFGAALFMLWRRASALSAVEKSILTGLLGAYFFQNLFVFDNITSLILFFTILAFIEGLTHEKNTSVSKGISADAATALTGSVVIATLIILYTVNYSGIKQNTTLLAALTEKTNAGPVHNLELFKEAIAYNSYGTSEVREQLMQITVNVLNATKERSQIQQQFISLATDEMKAQAEKLPNDARYQLFAGNFFSHSGDLVGSLPYLEKAHALSPQKQTIMFELGNVYYSLGDAQKAEAVFKEAYELAPAYPQAEDAYIKVLTRNHNTAEAERILKAHIAMHPDSLTAYAKLASFYLSLGRKGDAIATLKGAIVSNPAFKKEGETYIQQIEALGK